MTSHSFSNHIMASADFNFASQNNHQNTFKKVKNLLSELLNVVNDINVLYDSNNSDENKKSDPAIEFGNGIDCSNKVPHNWDTKSPQSNPIKALVAASSGNSSEYSNKSSQSNPIKGFGAASCGNSGDYSNKVPYNWDTKSSRSNPIKGFGAVSCENAGAYLNVPHDLDTKIYNPSIGSAFNANVSSYSNVMVNSQLETTHEKNQVMGIEVPNVYGFNERRLERALNEEASSINVPNYFSYLFGDYDAYDTQDYNLDLLTDNVIDVGISESTVIQKNSASHVEVEFISNVDGDIIFGLSDEATMLDSVNANFTTEPSSNKKLENHIVDTCIIGHQGCDNSGTFDHDSVPEADCEINVIDSETVEVRHRGCDNSKMFVPTSDAGPKLYCCMYCLGRFQKLERHLRTIHKEEASVKRFLAYPPRSGKRRVILAIIRKKGEFTWNNDLELNGGEYAVSRRPNKKFRKNPWDLIPCAKCLGAYTRTSLRRHWNNCSKASLKNDRMVQQMGRAVENRLHSDASEDLMAIFATFKENEIIRDVRFDWLVICYGNELCLNYSPHYQHGYICNKIRAAAKLLHVTKSILPEITDLSSLFRVKYSRKVIEAIYRMGKFDSKTKHFGSPGTASTTVTLINTIGELLVTEAMRMEDEDETDGKWKMEWENKVKYAERFLQVFKRDVRTKINKLVAVTKAKNRRNKKENIPTTADINKLVKFLDAERDASFLLLNQKFSYQNWLKLSQLTLVSILIYNRRRAGEMQNITVTNFNVREIIADQCDMLLSEISEEAKRKIKSRMLIRGKLNRTVPVLLKHSYDNCIEILIRYRKEAGISDGNEFLFSLPTESERIKTVNVWTIMRSFAIACGAKNPSSLRGTKLRKHMASFCATKNLNDNDVTNLADYMGHRDQVHRAIYRNNPLTSQVSQMAGLLDSAQGNDSSDDSEDEREDEAADEAEDEAEDENEIESEGDTAKTNTTRKTTKKTVIPKGKTSMPPEMKKKRNDIHKETYKKRNTTATTQELMKKRNVKVANKKRKTSVPTKMNKKRNVTLKRTNKKRKL